MDNDHPSWDDAPRRRAQSGAFDHDGDADDEEPPSPSPSSVASLPPVFAASVPFPLIPAVSRKRGWVLLNLLQDSRAVRSFPLFILSTLLFTTCLLISSAGLGLTSTCRQFTALDLVNNGYCNPEGEGQTLTSVWADHTASGSILGCATILVWVGNSVYHRWGFVALVPSLALQVWALTWYLVDIPFCQWDRLASLSHVCLTPGGHPLPAPTRECEAQAVAECEAATDGGGEFLVVSYFNLCMFAFILLLLLVSAWCLGTAVMKRLLPPRCTAPSAPASSDLSLPLTMDGSIAADAAPAALHAAPPDQLRWFWAVCDQRVFRPYFSSDVYEAWQDELDGDNDEARLVRELPISQSLRVSFVLTFALVANTVLTLALLLFAYITPQRAMISAMVGSLFAYLLVWVMAIVHVCALRLHIRHRVLLYVRAEVQGGLHRQLERVKLRYLSVPFYAGSVFGSLLWTFVIASALSALLLFAASEESVLEWVWAHLWQILHGVLWPLLSLFVYRCVAAFLVFHRCVFNSPTPILRRLRSPRLYLLLDLIGMWIGGWASAITICMRIVVALPTAIGRLDMPTGAWDVAHMEFKALVEVESWRVWRDWKRRLNGVEVWQKDGEWELEEIEEHRRQQRGVWNL